MNNKKGYVYFIKQSNELNKFKIGKTDNIKRRLRQLQCGNPNKLYCYSSIYCNNYDKLEKDLHSYFNNLRLNNSTNCEWFNVNQKDIDDVINKMTSLNIKKDKIVNINHYHEYDEYNDKEYQLKRKQKIDMLNRFKYI